jgi:hypothetical protein
LSTASTLSRGTGKLVLAVFADAAAEAEGAEAAPPSATSVVALSEREHATTDDAIKLPTTMAISFEKERMIRGLSKERTYHRDTTPRKSRGMERSQGGD